MSAWHRLYMSDHLDRLSVMHAYPGIIDQCVLDERWVGIVGKGTTLNGVPVRAAGAASLKQSMVYATTPEMFKVGWERQRYVRGKRVVPGWAS